MRRAVHDFDIHYPVAVDSNYVIWRAFENQYWPADYFVDAMGRIRGHQFGEGDYDGSERLIRELLTQAGYTELPPPASGIEGQGVQAPPDQADINSPETYVGYARAQSFSSPGGIAQDRSNAYSVPAALALNQWALAGMWTRLRRGRHAVARAGHNRLSFPGSRPASRARAGRRRQVHPLSRYYRRP